MGLKKPDISVLVVNYHQDKDLKKLVKNISIFLKGISYEILVFDNSVTLPPSNKYRVFSTNQNVGYATGVNYLSENAKGNYLLITNPDVTYLGSLKGSFTKFKSLPVYYGLLSLGEKEKLYKAPILNIFNSKKRFSSFSFLIYKDVYKSLGGFDNRYFVYFEDNQLALKLELFGIRTFYLKKPLAKHKKTYTNINFGRRKLLYYQSLKAYLHTNYKFLYVVYLIPLQFLLFITKVWSKIS